MYKDDLAEEIWYRESITCDVCEELDEDIQQCSYCGFKLCNGCNSDIDIQLQKIDGYLYCKKCIENEDL
jgi:hypothetical protein